MAIVRPIFAFVITASIFLHVAGHDDEADPHGRTLATASSSQRMYHSTALQRSGNPARLAPAPTMVRHQTARTPPRGTSTPSHAVRERRPGAMEAGPTSPVQFIHIGKCGGTAIDNWLTQKSLRHHEIHGTQPSHAFLSRVKLFIVFVRDPLARFVSAFEYQRAVIDADATNIRKEHPCPANAPPGTPCSFAPDKVLFKALYGAVYPDPKGGGRFEPLMRSFRDANDLAEHLSSPGRIGDDARLLMAYRLEHLFKGIGYYLHNGSFVQKYSQRIFVGSTEHMADSLSALARRLAGSRTSSTSSRSSSSSSDRGIPPSTASASQSATTSLLRQTRSQARMREMPKSQRADGASGGQTSALPLSPRARRNLHRFYRATDYAALRELVSAGLLHPSSYDLGPWPGDLPFEPSVELSPSEFDAANARANALALRMDMRLC